MFGLGFLIIVTLYLAIPLLIWKYFKGLTKKFGVIILLLLPLIPIFYFYFFSSYSKFRSLCNGSNRYIVNSIDVDYIPPFSGCKNGFDVMVSKNYKGFECESYQGKANEFPRSFSLYQFIPNEHWNLDECKHACFKGQPYAWEETCLDVCFSKIPISVSSAELEFKSGHSNSPTSRIGLKTNYVINKQKKTIASAINYEYYIFGNGVAKVLGGGSGDAPRLKCEKEYSVFDLDFLPEK